jgi:transcriptional regulator with XRE-family HTH domain
MAQLFYKKFTIIFKPMKTLADRLNQFKKKNRLTWEAFAEKLGEKHSTLMAYATNKRQPKGDFYTNFEKVYGFDIAQYEDKNVTNVPHETPKSSMVKESFYRDLIENNQEYSLIPRAVLTDYKIVPEKIIDMIYSDKEELKNALISKYEMIISNMEREVNNLRSRLGET